MEEFNKILSKTAKIIHIFKAGHVDIFIRTTDLSLRRLIIYWNSYIIIQNTKEMMTVKELYI
jgi:hypothetical protein